MTDIRPAFTLPVWILLLGLTSIFQSAQLAAELIPLMNELRLPPCPDTPNCVSSQPENPSHFVEPLCFQGDAEAAWDRFTKVIRAYPRTRIIRQTDNYLHAEFRTRWLNFKDDVEAILDRESACIQIRSASRIGYSDLGANRRRIESLRAEFETAPDSH